ncbi:hypothetical protein B296_00032697 [Ensete ventricosum]|uniref:Uncharacterized protein n=1 Tax=Ensete ventricosum TaxID=4639 RepID=A0A427AD21_ENSVE|nr:hypothetical protein B296_00032697 [Ensete ventricosum]
MAVGFGPRGPTVNDRNGDALTNADGDGRKESRNARLRFEIEDTCAVQMRRSGPKPTERPAHMFQRRVLFPTTTGGFWRPGNDRRIRRRDSPASFSLCSRPATGRLQETPGGLAQYPFPVRPIT